MSSKSTQIAAGCGCLFLAPFVAAMFVFALLALLPVSDLKVASEPASPAATETANVATSDPTLVVWPHRVGKPDKIPRTKYAVDLAVAVIDGNAPTAADLETIAAKIRSENTGYATYFVAYYLPGMALNAGAFATCHSQDGNAIKFPFADMPSRISGFPEIYDPLFTTPAGNEFPTIMKDGRPYSAEPDKI